MRASASVWLTALALGALAVASGVAGCFSPDQPACAFSCAEAPHTCPTGFMCGPDSLCHDLTSTTACRINLSDAAVDAGSDVRSDSGTGG
jgi:hypothetical protein